MENLDSVNLFIFVRFIGALAFICGGIYVCSRGWKVFWQKGQKVVMSVGWLKIKASGMGAVIMATSVAWGYLALAYVS